MNRILIFGLLAIRSFAQTLTYDCQWAVCEGNDGPSTSYVQDVVNYFCDNTLSDGEGCYGPSAENGWEVMIGFSLYDSSTYYGWSYSEIPPQSDCISAFDAIVNECFAQGAIRGAATLNGFEYAIDGCGSNGECKYSF